MDIRELMKFYDLRNASMGRNLRSWLQNLDHGKIIDLLTVGQGKWEATKKNPHHAINRGSLIDVTKVWFYFIASVILPTKHL